MTVSSFGLCGAVLGAVVVLAVLLGDRRSGADRRRAPGRRSGPGRVRVDRGRPRRNRSAGRPSPPARWASAADVRPLVVPAPLGDRPPGRLVLGRTGRRLLATEAAHSLAVFGPTQSGKTTGLAIPLLLEWHGPVVAASVKGDLLAATAGRRSRCGTVQVFDPTGATGRSSASWTPLRAAATWPGARRVAASLTEVAKGTVGTMSDGDFWYATAAKMLAPLLFAAASGGRSMADVIRWIDTREEDEVLVLLEASGVPEAMDAALSGLAKDERQFSSIVTTVETVLEPFADGVGATGAPILPAALLRGADSLYLCAPAHDQRRLAPVFVGIVREIVDTAYEWVIRTGRPLDPPLLVVLDEAANIAPLADLDGLASTAAGHGIQLVTIWQDLAQLTARYGPRATTVVNNHRAKLFLSGISDPATLDYASHLVGEGEVESPSVTSGGATGRSVTRATTVRRLAPPDAVRRIRPGEGVLLYRDLPPIRLALRPWYDDPGLRELAGEDRDLAGEDAARGGGSATSSLLPPTRR